MNFQRIIVLFFALSMLLVEMHGLVTSEDLRHYSGRPVRGANIITKNKKLKRGDVQLVTSPSSSLKVNSATTVENRSTSAVWDHQATTITIWTLLISNFIGWCVFFAKAAFLAATIGIQVGPAPIPPIIPPTVTTTTTTPIITSTIPGATSSTITPYPIIDGLQREFHRRYYLEDIEPDQSRRPMPTSIIVKWICWGIAKYSRPCRSSKYVNAQKRPKKLSSSPVFL